MNIDSTGKHGNMQREIYAIAALLSCYYLCLVLGFFGFLAVNKNILIGDKIGRKVGRIYAYYAFI